MEIHVYRGTENLGAYTLEETAQYLSEGRLVDTDMVWYAGLDDWKQLGEVRDQLTSQQPPAEYAATQAIPPETYFTRKSALEDDGKQRPTKPEPPASPSTFGHGRYKAQQLLEYRCCMGGEKGHYQGQGVYRERSRHFPQETGPGASLYQASPSCNR